MKQLLTILLLTLSLTIQAQDYIKVVVHKDIKPIVKIYDNGNEEVIKKGFISIDTVVESFIKKGYELKSIQSHNDLTTVFWFYKNTEDDI